MFNKKTNELIQQAFIDYANELEAEIIRWEKQHPEEAKIRDEYWESRREEFEKKLMAKIQERQCK